jgi:hypothetical protein
MNEIFNGHDNVMDLVIYISYSKLENTLFHLKYQNKRNFEKMLSLLIFYTHKLDI